MKDSWSANIRGSSPRLEENKNITIFHTYKNVKKLHTWGQRTYKTGAVQHGQENGPLYQNPHGHPPVHRTTIKEKQT